MIISYIQNYLIIAIQDSICKGPAPFANMFITSDLIPEVFCLRRCPFVKLSLRNLDRQVTLWTPSLQDTSILAQRNQVKTNDSIK